MCKSDLKEIEITIGEEIKKEEVLKCTQDKNPLEAE